MNGIGIFVMARPEQSNFRSVPDDFAIVAAALAAFEAAISESSNAEPRISGRTSKWRAPPATAVSGVA